MPFIQILRGPNEGAVILTGSEPVVLGRNPDCTVVIPATCISRRHARIVRVGDGYFLDDLQSRNGTFVNNQAINARTTLKNNDRIRICDFIAVFHDEAEDLDPLDPIPLNDLADPIVLELQIPPVLTEQQWLACIDPAPMLEFLSAEARAERLGLAPADAPTLSPGRPAGGEARSERKFRLFTCACARRIWDLLTQRANQRGVEVAERYADGEATDEDLAKVREEMARASLHESMVGYYAARGSGANVRSAACEAARAVEAARGGACQERREAERAELAGLLRDIFRPFRPLRVEPAWLAWEGGVVSRLARAASEERRLPEGALEPACLAVLADALEEAGCSCSEWLGHLRGSGPHVRGCWAVDLCCDRQ
jgi:hypothetical protein